MSSKHTVRSTIAVASIAFVAACADSPVSPSAALPDAEPSLAMSPTAQARLAAKFGEASAEVLDIAGTVYADHDEVSGRLKFGVENAKAQREAERALKRLGLASSEYSIVMAEPVVQLATLRDVFRPTQAGIQIHFGGYVCTLGFNVDHSAGRSFITNSHCTNRQGGTEGTQYFQPLSSVNGTVIATEAADPKYARGAGCPKGKVCRRSDASRALYAAGTASSRGRIAKTTGPNNNSLTTSGFFTITSQNNNASPAAGTVVNKVGRTTGWTQGPITATCVNTNVSGSNITQLCQTFVTAGVNSGDSGSPVFRITSGDNVQLLGILWGGSGSSFVFSPLQNIQQELGSVIATQ